MFFETMLFFHGRRQMKGLGNGGETKSKRGIRSRAGLIICGDDLNEKDCNFDI
jgi:hypothetical protein